VIPLLLFVGIGTGCVVSLLVVLMALRHGGQ
jgi:hypothetical protein